MSTATISNNGLLTIAIGKKFIRFARYLAMSGIMNSPSTLRAVITDDTESLRDYYDILIPCDNTVSDPFKVKTQLYEYTPFNVTMFIDSDSLIIQDLNQYFNINESFSINGPVVKEGEWYSLNIKEIMEKFSLDWFPCFNSGMFLFKKDNVSKKVFKDAQNAFAIMKELGVPYFRDKFMPDEPAFALSLAQNNIAPVNDYGRYSRTLISRTSNIVLNVQNRKYWFKKNNVQVYPTIVHFAGKLGDLLYVREQIRLKLAFSLNINNFFGSLITSFLFSLYYFFFQLRDYWFRVLKKIEKS